MREVRYLNACPILVCFWTPLLVKLEQKRREREASKPPRMPPLPARRPLPSSLSVKKVSMPEGSTASERSRQPCAPGARSVVGVKVEKGRNFSRKPVDEAGVGRSSESSQATRRSLDRLGERRESRESPASSRSACSSADATVRREERPRSAPTAKAFAGGRDRTSRPLAKEVKAASLPQPKRTADCQEVASKSSCRDRGNDVIQSTKPPSSVVKSHSKAPVKPMSFASLMKMAKTMAEPDDHCGGQPAHRPDQDQPFGRQLIEGRPRTSLPGKAPRQQGGDQSCTPAGQSLQSITPVKARAAEKSTTKPKKVPCEFPPRASCVKMSNAGSPLSISRDSTTKRSAILAKNNAHSMEQLDKVDRGKGPMKDLSARPHDSHTVHAPHQKTDSSKPGLSGVTKPVQAAVSRKRGRPPFMEDEWSDEDDPEAEDVDVSKYIRRIFGYDKRR